MHVLRPFRLPQSLLVAAGALAALAAAAPAEPRPDPAAEGLAGTWIFVEDASEGPVGRTPRPNSGARFDVSVDADAVVFQWGPAGKGKGQRFPADGSEETVTEGKTVSRHRGTFSEGAFRIESSMEAPGKDGATVTAEWRQTLAVEGDVLVVERMTLKPVQRTSKCRYRRAPKDAAKPVAAEISAVAWMSGAWVGTQGKASIEERWGPPAGGAILATARTVAGGRMVMFEYLRVVERDGGLVYVAQPGGGPPTDFWLTSVSAEKAVFENPVHDFPQRVTYALGDGGTLTAEIADLAGTKSQTFRFRRE